MVVNFNGSDAERPSARDRKCEFDNNKNNNNNNFEALGSSGL